MRAASRSRQKPGRLTESPSDIGPDVADYLAVPLHRQERAVVEKARSARRGELRWIRSYADDVLDDLFGEPIGLRFIDVALLALASKSGWLIPYDTRWLAGKIGVRGREVKPAVERLLTLGRLELVTASDDNRNGQGVQPALFASGYPQVQDPPGTTPGSARDHSGDTPEITTPQQESGLERDSWRNGAAQNRTREEIDLDKPVRQETEEPSGISTETSNPVTARLVAIAKIPAGTPSARFVATETEGLPDAAIVSVIESYLRKRPRPANPAGWIVNALRAQRRDRRDPEPPL